MKVICNKAKSGECRDQYCDEATPHEERKYLWPKEISCTEEQPCKRRGFPAVRCTPTEQ